jgi:hypothetical protein
MRNDFPVWILIQTSRQKQEMSSGIGGHFEERKSRKQEITDSSSRILPTEHQRHSLFSPVPRKPTFPSDSRKIERTVAPFLPAARIHESTT